MTLSDYPRLASGTDCFVAEFAPNVDWSACVPVRMVIDLGDDASVLGVEILNLASQLGPNSLGVIEQVCQGRNDGKYSYDDESDSFYLRLDVGRSSSQRALDGCVVCDAHGRIIAIRTDPGT